VGLIKEQKAALAEREVAVVEGEAKLAAHQEEKAAQTQRLQEQEAAMEEELSVGTRRLQEREVALQEKEAKVEEFLEERSASIDRIVRWVDEVNPSLDALGLSTIQVTEVPPSLGAILPVLDSTAKRLRHVEASIFDLLEIDGQAVA
jgi:hypothetical protein